MRSWTMGELKSLALIYMCLCRAFPATTSCIEKLLQGSCIWCHHEVTGATRYALNTVGNDWGLSWGFIPVMSKNVHFPKDSTSSVLLSCWCCFTVVDLHTTCHVSPQKSAWAGSSRQETPSEHSNRNSPPTSLPSLPPSLWSDAGPGSVAPASLGFRMGGRDWVNIWLIVHCRLWLSAHQHTSTSWEKLRCTLVFSSCVFFFFLR